MIALIVVTRTPSLSPYPWDRLECLERTLLQADQTLSEQLNFPQLVRGFCAALETWSGQSARFERRRIRWCDELPREPAPRLMFRGTARPGAALVCIDPRLCIRVAQQLAGGRPAFIEPSAPIDSGLLGAVAALVCHLAEQAGYGEPFRVDLANPGVAGQLTIEGTLHWGAGHYEIVLLLELPPAHPTRAPRSDPNLERLGAIPLTLRLFVGEAELDSGELQRLRPGDVVIPGESNWLDLAGNGEGYLTAEGSPWAYPVSLIGGREIVLGPRAVNRDIEEPAQPAVPDQKLGLGRLLADARVTAQIELGSISLPVERLARLEPGDVLETSQAIGEPAMLRVRGQAVALGELVNVDGQVGLRIVELLTGESK